MDVSSINSDLIRGNVTTIILKALLDEDRYGYDILREIEVKSGGQYKLKQPTLYSCLKRLEKQGLISSYWGDESDTEGGRRRYYALTEAGRNYLNKMQSEYEYSRTILDSLLSEEKFDFENNDAPFDINSLRPYTKRTSGDDDDEKQTETSKNNEITASSENTSQVIRGVPSNTGSTSQSSYKSVYGNDFQAPLPEKEDQKAMFGPFDRGAGSYDDDLRHTSSSVSDMLSKIDDILTKNENSAEAGEKATPTTLPPSNSADNNETHDVKSQNLSDKERITPAQPLSENEQIVTPEEILFGKKDSEIKTEETDAEKQAKVDAAKKALSIGAYRDESLNIVENYDARRKLFEKTSSSPSDTDASDVNPDDNTDSFTPSSRELLFGKQNDEVRKEPDADEAHIRAARIILDKYNKKEESAPADNPPYFNPYMIFDKYSKPKKDEPDTPAYDAKDVFSKYDEKPAAEEKKYKAEEIFDKYNPKKSKPSTNEDEKHYDPKEIFDKYKKKEEPDEKESAKVNLAPSPVPPASTFSFRRDEESTVNYRDAFSSLRHTENSSSAEETENLRQKPASNIDLKTKLFSEGYKLRPYSRENTENYYSLNYIKKNRLNRDTYAITYLLICLETLIGWAIFKDRYAPMAYAAVCIIALLVPAVPFVIWTINPDKRVHANYNFRTSLLNRLMLYLNLLVIVCLIGFFGFGANINNGESLITPILIPALLLLNIPLSACVYCILYKTKKYHIS